MEPLFPSPYFRGLILVTALGFMALEYGLGRLVHRETHDWRESAATLASRSCRTSFASSRPVSSRYRSRSSTSTV